MTTKYVQEGKVIDYANAGSAIVSGAVVVIGTIIGVALGPIASGATGPVQIEGVFTLPKVSGAVIGVGQTLTWDVSANSNAGAFDDDQATPATGDITGASAFAVEAAGNGDTEVVVKLTGVPGTVN